MIWVRGAPADYDGWAQPGWTWPEVAPLFDRIENDLLETVPNLPLHPIQQSILDAAIQCGLPFNPDYNSGVQDGVSVERITATAGPTRLTTWRAYAKPSTVTVHTGAHVHRLVITRGRCTGVVATIDNTTQELSADLVVLSAGALGSPTILLRSGIGPASGLPVGHNLHDHLLAPVIFTTDSREVVPDPNQSPTQVHWFWRSDPDLTVPDTQPICFSVPMYEPWMTGPPTGFSLMAGIVTPRGRGTLTLDEQGNPLIDLAALEDPADLASLVASVNQCREVGHAITGDWGVRELYPCGADVEDYVRRTVVTYHHQVGTCAMGTVVDPTLKVHGVEGLRVADASVMPKVTTGNTNAPAVLIGEQAARFI
ncbi:GMC family oxidoreductase, partial [Kibdelosporangium lantanae]